MAIDTAASVDAGTDTVGTFSCHARGPQMSIEGRSEALTGRTDTPGSAAVSVSAAAVSARSMAAPTIWWT
ncbi:hypothetical protein, partial [Kitasatospora griseola]|uniref:hypothetical protein n=1 Tax=Kitasatospora griseola TaxID=2064 RepID=UPI0037F9E6B7